MAEYKLRVLKMGQCDVPGPEVYWMSHWFEWETLYFYMVVIQGEGITAIINTGPPADSTELNQLWRAFAGERCQMLRQEEERPLAALESIGIHAHDVQYVLLMFWVGVHHRSSMAIAVPTRQGRVIISDSFLKYGNI
jgi:hypothetical protein